MNVKDHGIYPGGQDNTYPLRKMLDQIKGQENIMLLFEKGEYHFKPDFGYERLLYIANHHEDTVKKIIFDLSDFKDLEIEGGGSDFIFYLDCIPFYANKAENLVFKNFTIDYSRPSYSQGEVLAVTPEEMTLSIDNKEYPHKVEHGRLFFYGDDLRMELWGWLEFDKVRSAPVEQILDVYINQEGATSLECREIDENTVVFKQMDGRNFLPQSKEGNFIVLRHHLRTHPGFYITKSENIKVSSVACYHSLGIGFMAEFTKNIKLDSFRVCKDKRNPRIFTAAADATHFVYCGGLIEIKNCLFENQLDDAANVHGIYARIEKVLSPNEFIVYLVHDMHRGVVMAEPQDRIAVLESDTFRSIGNVMVEENQWLNQDYQYIKIKEPLDQLKEGQVIENREWVPDVWIHHCTFRNNRARGLLLTTGGKVKVENNLFENAGAAILLEGDASGWFESGATEDILIKNNRFHSCSYVQDWGKAPIQSTPSVVKREGYPYHKKVEIIENEFLLFDERILYMNHVGQLVFKDNIIGKNNDFTPVSGIWAECFDIGEFTTSL